MIPHLLLLALMVALRGCSCAPLVPAVVQAWQPPATEAPAPAMEDVGEEASGTSERAGRETGPPRAANESSEDPVVALLDRLEKSAADLETFRAGVRYETEDALLGQKVIRTGQLVYRTGSESVEKSFAIDFDSVIENRRKRDRHKRYVFSGRWLVEVDVEEKMFIKREIVPPGKEFDPLKLGEGPFPLPIGQAREDVLARFDVSLIELPAEGALAKLKGRGELHGLRLVPKPDTPAAEDFAHIDLFYDAATLLPAGVEVIETNGDRKTARLDDIERNPALDQAALAKLSVAEPDPASWRIDVRPWQDGE